MSWNTFEWVAKINSNHAAQLGHAEFADACFSLRPVWKELIKIVDFRTILSDDNLLVKLLLPRRLRILKSWLQLLCFVLNFRRPWWKDCCLLRYCLFWFQWYGQEVWNILGTPRPVEISLVQFAYHWFSFAFHDFSGPVCVSGGALWCVVLWARWSKLHMPTHAGCCALSAIITLALSQNKALAWAALLLPSFGIAEADFVPLHNFMPGDRRYNNSCFLFSLSLEAYFRCWSLCIEGLWIEVIV